MGFQKGHAKVGGRKAGVVNALTKQRNEMVSNFIERNWEDFENNVYPNLSDKDKKDAILNMLSYICPKLQSVDVSAEVKTNESALETIRNVVNDSDII